MKISFRVYLIRIDHRRQFLLPGGKGLKNIQGAFERPRPIRDVINFVTGNIKVLY